MAEEKAEKKEKKKSRWLLWLIVFAITISVIVKAFDTHDKETSPTKEVGELQVVKETLLNLAPGEKKRFETTINGELYTFTGAFYGYTDQSKLYASNHGKFGADGDNHLVGTDIHPSKPGYSFANSGRKNPDVFYIWVTNTGPDRVIGSVKLWGYPVKITPPKKVSSGK